MLCCFLVCALGFGLASPLSAKWGAWLVCCGVDVQYKLSVSFLLGFIILVFDAMDLSPSCSWAYQDALGGISAFFKALSGMVVARMMMMMHSSSWLLAGNAYGNFAEDWRLAMPLPFSSVVFVSFLQRGKVVSSSSWDLKGFGEFGTSIQCTWL